MTNYSVNKKALYASANVLYKQLLLGGVCIVASALSFNVDAIVSACFGFILVFIPTLVYVKISNMRKIMPVYQVYSKHQKAELMKFTLNFIGFILVFVFYRNVHVLAFFATYVVTLSSYWLGLFSKAK